MTVRFWTLVGVSSDIQAGEDKDSIPDQIKTCRGTIQHYDGIEAGLSIMDGYSRSGYDSLTDAMNDIPPLRETVEAAEQNKYDVLLLDNWDRLGDLGQLVLTRFRKYRKQIYSARQSGILYPPSEYDPTSDEGAEISMHIQGIIQRYRINKLRRGFKLGMPKRVRDGLHPNKPPYGFKYVGKKEPMQPVPHKIEKLITAREMLLRGAGRREIGEVLGVDGSRVRDILCNPYYAGKVAYNRTLYVPAPVKNRRRAIPQPKSKWQVNEGKHEAVFTQAEHESILAEYERRDELVRRYKIDYVFAGLVHCDVCGATIRRQLWTNHPGRNARALCSRGGSGHFTMLYSEFFELIALEIQKFAQTEYSGEHTEESRDNSELIRQSLAENKKQRARVQDGFKSGIYTASEAQAELAKLDKENDRLTGQLESIATRKANRAGAREAMGKIDWTDTGEWLAMLREEDSAMLNQLLTGAIQTIRITTDGKVKITGR